MAEEHSPSRPESAEEWAAVLAAAVGLAPEEAAAQYKAGRLPKALLMDRLETEYAVARGYPPDFVTALTRNFEGLLAWAFGGGEEPYWPGTDGDQPARRR